MHKQSPQKHYISVTSEYKNLNDLDVVTSDHRQQQQQFWKLKYDHLSQMFIQMKGKYERELFTMTQEIQQLINTLQLFEQQTAMQTQTMNNSTQNEEQNKKQQQIIEQLQKQLNEHISIRDKQVKDIEQLTQKVFRIQQQDDVQIRDIHNENLLLRKQLQEKEGVKQQELEQITSELSKLYALKIQNIQKLHTTSIQNTQNEMGWLKRLIDNKNIEIAALINQNQQMRSGFQNEIQQLNKDIINLQEVLQINEQKCRVSTQEISHKKNEENYKQQKAIQQGYDDILLEAQNENEDLKLLLASKDNQLQQQVQEGQRQRNYYDEQLVQAHQNISKLQQDIQLIREQHNQDILNMEQCGRQEQQIQQDMIDNLRIETKFLSEQIEQLKEQILQKGQTIESNSNQYNLQLKRDQEKLDYLLQSNRLLQCQLEELQLKQQVDYQEQSQNHVDVENQLRELIVQKDIELERRQQELLLQQQNNDKLAIDLVVIHNQKLQWDVENRRLRDEMTQIQSQGIEKEQQMLREQHEFVSKMEQSQNYHVQQLQQSQDMQLRILEQDNEHLKYLLHHRMNHN